jgi:hypothetical protein
MWLLDVSTFQLHDFLGPTVPPYAILSHTWGPEEEEVSFSDLRENLSDARTKRGFDKIEGSCVQARNRGLRYIWIDTCCINKENESEFSHAINSMFTWYEQSQVCFAYLVDVPLSGYSGFADTADAFSKSRWFIRGWTIQELIAPSRVEFYSKDWCLIQATTKPDGDISIIIFLQKICNITGIRCSVLTDPLAVSSIPFNEKLSWISCRFTTKEEDMAYCLMGIIGVRIPVRYGEGLGSAFTRLDNSLELAQEYKNGPVLVHSFD